VRKQMYAEIPRMHTGSGCTDTVGWKSPAKHTCSEYETKFKWCKNGKAMPNQEWTLGKRWGYPERHCCACGRLAGADSPSPTLAPTTPSPTLAPTSALGNACAQWRRCLDTNPHEQRLEHYKALLQAVEAKTAPRLYKKSEPCEDNDAGLFQESGRNVPNCKAAKQFCVDPTFGPMAQKKCPKTCGSCTATPAAPVTELADLNDIEPGIDTDLAVHGWTLTPKSQPWTQTPTEDQACFPDPASFDCACHRTIVSQCDHPNGFRRELGRSLTQCYHFFVCTHSQTCKSYKERHCKDELALLVKLKKKGRAVETC